jgi:hypothetical protein
MPAKAHQHTLVRLMVPLGIDKQAREVLNMKIPTWWCTYHESTEADMRGCCQRAEGTDVDDGSECKWKAVWLSGRRIT